MIGPGFSTSSLTGYLNFCLSPFLSKTTTLTFIKPAFTYITLPLGETSNRCLLPIEEKRKSVQGCDKAEV